MNLKTKNFQIGLFFLVLAFLLGAGAWIFIPHLEGGKPEITLAKNIPAIGAEAVLEGKVADPGNGIRSLHIELAGPGGKLAVLLDEQYGKANLLAKGDVPEKTFSIPVRPKKLGFPDGEATLRVTVRDHSMRDWGKGNLSHKEITVPIDSRPPSISVLTRAHYLNQGGAGLVIYQVSETGAKTGVRVGDRFFDGYSGHFKDPNIFLGFFALAHNQGPETQLRVEAQDAAGNVGTAGFPNKIKPKKFKDDTLEISDNFIQTVAAQFAPDHPELSQGTLLDRFLFINRKLRQANYETAVAVYKNSDKALHWTGEFLRLPNAAPRAAFADHRSYRYQGAIVDDQYHLGVDLASLALSPVPAANAGKVVFAEAMGIYGNTVFVDHGFGILSQYSHLSAMDVAVGQMVKKGDLLGKSGATGLAGGDHLHFGMMVQHTFVNPIEWWDPHWIEDNVASKIRAVEGGGAE